MPSPSCEVKNGAAAYVTAVGGVNVTPGETVVIRLASTTDVDAWSIECITTDNSSSAAAVSASLVIDSTLRTASFTAPAAGKTYRFRSRVNSGIDRNGVAQTSYSTTFCLYTVKNGRRKWAADETTEGDSVFGYITQFNDLIDSVPSGSGAWDTGGGGGGSFQLYGASNQFLTYQGGSAVGATGMNHVPTTGVVELNRGLRVVGTAVATLASAMLVSGTGATGFNLVRPVMLGPIMGGTMVHTGTDEVAHGLTNHSETSARRTVTTNDATVLTVYSFKPLDEAITSVFAEFTLVASGAEGGGSYGRAVAIKMNNGVATCSSIESTYNQEFTHSGVGFTGYAVGSGLNVGISGTTGFVTVAGSATGVFWGGVTTTLRTTKWG